MSVKLQINSLEALERLLGGDSELEIEMRKSIAYDFTTKYLKTLANDPAVQNHMNEARRQLADIVKVAVEKEIGTAKSTNYYPYTVFHFNSQIMEQVNKQITDKVGEFVKTSVANAIDKYCKPEDIAKKIDREIITEIHNRVRDGVKARMEELQKELAKIPELIKNT